MKVSLLLCDYSCVQKYVINVLLASSFHQLAQYVTINCGGTKLFQYKFTNYFSQHKISGQHIYAT